MSQLASLSPLEKFRALSSQRHIPLQAALELTYRCNERCTHCYLEKFADDPQRVLRVQDWFKILTELREAGTLYLVLMGGEAMLSPLFWQVCQRASELSFHISMISNGLKINNLAVAQKLKDHGVHVVSLSLYSLDDQIHDKMTSVKGSLAKTLAAIAYCREVGLQVGINVLLTEANAAGIFAIYDWCIERGLEIKVDPTVTPKLNGDLAPTKYRATKETLKWFYREKARRWPKGRPVSANEQGDNYACNAAKGKCAVNPYGELLPCIEVREPLGNLARESFADIWFSEKAKPWRELRVKQLTNTGGMATYNFCDHCPGMAQHEHGDATRITDFSKMMAQAKREVAREV